MGAPRREDVVGPAGIEKVGERAVKRAREGRRGRAPRVLVVEDEALICVETADTLEHQGFEVHVALSAEDALRRLRGGLPIDILFTDINLAGPMSGETLAVLGRALLPAGPVVSPSRTVGA